jgi:hypothetical protein
MVRDVEELKSQLDLLLFLDIETPAYRGINIKIRRPEQRIRPQVAKCADCVRHESSGAYPLLSMQVPYIRVSDDIGTIVPDAREGIVEAGDNRKPCSAMDRESLLSG